MRFILPKLSLDELNLNVNDMVVLLIVELGVFYTSQ